MKNFIIFCTLSISFSFGQNSLFFQQKASYNPAMANIENKTNISFATIIAYNTYYSGRLNLEHLVKNHHNLSLNAGYERLSGYNLFNTKFGYAYTFNFSDELNINLGADVGLGVLTSGNASTASSRTGSNFNGDIGVSIHGLSYYGGLNLQFVSKTNILVTHPSGLFMNVMAGFTKPIGDNYRFAMDAMFNTSLKQGTGNISARINIFGYFWLGLGYRYYEDIFGRRDPKNVSYIVRRHDLVVPIGLQAKNFTFSYAFNYDLSSATANFSSTFHELMLGWRIPHDNRKNASGAQYIE